MLQKLLQNVICTEYKPWFVALVVPVFLVRLKYREYFFYFCIPSKYFQGILTLEFGLKPLVNEVICNKQLFLQWKLWPGLSTLASLPLLEPGPLQGEC